MSGLRADRLAAGLLEWAVMLLPVLVYLLYLAFVVNRRRRPLPVSGAADQFLLIIALSGFLLVGPFTWPLHFLRGIGERTYWLGYSAYLLVVLGVILGSLRRQRDVLVTYNVNPNQFVEALREVLKDLGTHYVATPGRLALEDGQCVLDITASMLWHNVSLRWQGGCQAIRPQVEERLRLALKGLQTEGNPAALALLLMATIILFVIFFALALNALAP